eukprot:371160_1
MHMLLIIMLSFITCTTAMRWRNWCFCCSTDQDDVRLDPIHEISLINSPVEASINESKYPLSRMRSRPLLPTPIEIHNDDIFPNATERPPLLTPNTTERPPPLTPTDGMIEHHTTTHRGTIPVIPSLILGRNRTFSAEATHVHPRTSRNQSSPKNASRLLKISIHTPPTKFATPPMVLGATLSTVTGDSTIQSSDVTWNMFAGGARDDDSSDASQKMMKVDITKFIPKQFAKNTSPPNGTFVNCWNSGRSSTLMSDASAGTSGASSMHYHIKTWPFLTIRKKNAANETTTSQYYLKEQIGSGTFGTVYEGHPDGDNNTRLAIKFSVVAGGNTKKSDAHNEYCLCQQLAKRQVNETMENVVRIVNTKSNYKSKLKSNVLQPNVDYFIVMEYCPGTLRTLIDKQVKQHKSEISEQLSPGENILTSKYTPSKSTVNTKSANVFSEHEELEGMMVTLNVLKQCTDGLKQLQAVFPNVRFNDWSPDNILVSDTSIPIGKDVKFKLSDFGKAAVGKRKFGSAPYASNIDEPKANETQDINSISLIGLEVLSSFSSYDNAIWTVISSVMTCTMMQLSIPPLRDLRIELVTEEVARGEVSFQNKIVATFFQQLANFTRSEEVNFAIFDTFLAQSWLAASGALSSGINTGMHSSTTPLITPREPIPSPSSP